MEDLSLLSQRLQYVDHLAIAVDDLEAAVIFYRDRLGFSEVERRVTEGKKVGMESAVMKAGELKVVLAKGTSPESQISRYVAEYGPGVQLVAFMVQEIESVVADLRQRGLSFDADIVCTPGQKQAFSRRDPASGLMFGLIERIGGEEHADDHVRQLLESLVEKESF